MLNLKVTLAPGTNSLFTGDGLARVVHAKADSHSAKPVIGERISCVINTK